MTNQDIAKKMQTGEIDPNNQSLFFSILIKGLLYDLNRHIHIRGNSVPHYILNTGDATMYLEIKGHDHSKEPVEQTNEDYIYTVTPRSVLTPKGITLETDQLTSPYSRGSFQYETDDTIGTFVGEFRRIPFKMSFDLEYITDSFTDYLELIQQIITKMAFIRTFKVVYLGQTITCSYNIPDNFEGEHTIDFDLNTTDDRRHKLQLSIDVETNMPVFSEETCMSADSYIKNVNIETSHDLKIFPSGELEKGINYEGPR